jgi:hypothetical protein
MFRKLGLLIGAALLATSVGCIADHKYGCENTTLVPAGSPEGEVFAAHGCPDQVVEVGNSNGPAVKHWSKYLVMYRIGEGHMLLGRISQRDKFSNITYLVENGKVLGGGFVGEGEGSAILMNLKGAFHPKARVGYGGDNGYGGSYHGSGREGGSGDTGGMMGGAAGGSLMGKRY